MSLMTQHLIRIGLALVVMIALFVLTKKFTRYFLAKRDDRTYATFIMILEKIFYVTIVFVAILFILDEMGVRTSSILATAGIGTLILGLGAQSIIGDVLNGFFILAERQYAAGEYIRVGSLEGTVEDVGLRMTRIRSYAGEVTFVPNGMMKGVVNTSRAPMRAMALLKVSRDVPVHRVDEAIEEILPALSEVTREKRTNEIEYLGLTEMGERVNTYTLRTFTPPGLQWEVERTMLKTAARAVRGLEA